MKTKSNLEKKNRINNDKAIAKNNGHFEIGTIEANKVIDLLIKDFVSRIDFMVLVRGKKPTLLVPGADKLAFKFNLMSLFSKDTETLEMLSHVKGLVAFKCDLVSRKTGKKIGEGRGAAVLGEKENCKDPNSTIKMAEIRAKRDAVLNIFPIRDRFTQDTEDQKPEETKVKISADGTVEI